METKSSNWLTMKKNIGQAWENHWSWRIILDSRKVLYEEKVRIPIGQGCLLQVCVSVVFPVQLSPPFDGGGLVQFLVWFWMPPPQILLHVVHTVHVVKFPSVQQRNTVWGLLTSGNFLILLHTFSLFHYF